MPAPARPDPFLHLHYKKIELTLGRSFAFVLVTALIVVGAVISGQPLTPDLKTIVNAVTALIK